jgi:hypothetical protein
VAGMTRAAPAPPPAGSPVLTPGTSRPVPYLQVIIAALGVPHGPWAYREVVYL